MPSFSFLISSLPPVVSLPWTPSNPYPSLLPTPITHHFSPLPCPFHCPLLNPPPLSLLFPISTAHPYCPLPLSPPVIRSSAHAHCPFPWFILSACLLPLLVPFRCSFRFTACIRVHHASSCPLPLHSCCAFQCSSLLALLCSSSPLPLPTAHAIPAASSLAYFYLPSSTLPPTLPCITFSTFPSCRPFHCPPPMPVPSPLHLACAHCRTHSVCPLPIILAYCYSTSLSPKPAALHRVSVASCSYLFPLSCLLIR